MKMNLLANLLVAVTAAGAMGSVRADQTRIPDTHAPALPASQFVSGISASYSFADVVNFPDGAGHREATSRMSGAVSGMTPVDLADAADAVTTPVAVTNAGGSLSGTVSILNSTVGDLSAGVVSGDFSASRPGASGPSAGAKFPFSVTEIPDPADWMTLLCGLVVVAFMARRKSDRLSN